MFSVARQAALNIEVEWDPKRLEYIEAWSFRDGTNSHVRRGVLHKDECLDWLNHRASFAVPAEVTANQSNQHGGLRLLICDRTSLFPPGFGMTKESYEEAEKVLSLHPATLPSFLVQNGTHSRFIKRDKDRKLVKLEIVLKAPQKYEIANYGLSISYDVETGWTTGLLYGESVTETAWQALGRNTPSEKDQPKTWAYQSPSTKMFELLQTSSLPWNHPFLLPSALIGDHLARMRFFCEDDLTKEVMSIERELGIVRVGKRSEHGMSGLWPHFRPPKEDEAWTNALLENPTIMNSMTVRINTEYTKVIFTKRSPTWSHETSAFLFNVWQKVMDDIDPNKDYHNFLVESLDYTSDIAKSIENHVINLQTRMDLQLNILYSFVAQRDNRLNTRIARATGRDSVSMKILAFISALFLPATYIATLFSMQGLFNWEPQTDPSGALEPVVNEKFWIYWAITAPLTLITIIGWAFWWRYELQRLPASEFDAQAEPKGFLDSIVETLGLVSPSELNEPKPEPRRKSSLFVFNGRPKSSKEAQGAPLLGGKEGREMDVLSQAEAGAVRSPTETVSPTTLFKDAGRRGGGAF